MARIPDRCDSAAIASIASARVWIYIRRYVYIDTYTYIHTAGFVQNISWHYRLNVSYTVGERCATLGLKRLLYYTLNRRRSRSVCDAMPRICQLPAGERRQPSCVHVFTKEC